MGVSALAGSGVVGTGDEGVSMCGGGVLVGIYFRRIVFVFDKTMKGILGKEKRFSLF